MRRNYKLLIIMMVGMIAVAVCACKQNKKSDAAKHADELISAIGTVGPDSEKDIIAAENAVSSLSEDEIKSLEGMEDLKKARNDYDALIDAGLVSEVESKIDAIGTVTVDSKDAIDEAQTAYDLLDDRLKSQVSNLNVLENAHSAYDDSLMVYAVEEKISAIGTVTVDSKETIDEAQAAYDSLEDRLKNSVSNLNILEEAQESFEGIKADLEAHHEEDLELYDKYMKATEESMKFVDALDESVVSDLDFIAKYAGNVNGSGKRKFADEFTDRMKTAFDGIDVSVISEGNQKLGDLADEIIENYKTIRDLLITMGQTNSDKDVEKIRQMAQDTAGLGSQYCEEALDFVEELETVKARIDAYNKLFPN